MTDSRSRYGPLHPAPVSVAARLAPTSLGRERQLEVYRWLQLNRRVEVVVSNDDAPVEPRT